MEFYIGCRQWNLPLTEWQLVANVVGGVEDIGRGLYIEREREGEKQSLTQMLSRPQPPHSQPSRGAEKHILPPNKMYSTKVLTCCCFPMHLGFENWAADLLSYSQLFIRFLAPLFLSLTHMHIVTHSGHGVGGSAAGGHRQGPDSPPEERRQAGVSGQGKPESKV